LCFEVGSKKDKKGQKRQKFFPFLQIFAFFASPSIPIEDINDEKNPSGVLSDLRGQHHVIHAESIAASTIDSSAGG
jgi:hypothetical protein